MRLDDTQLTLLRVLLEDHDGDDRCGCLGFAVYEACTGDPAIALGIVLNCHEGHTAKPWGKS